ncbi:MAG: dethiobiotin synthase [Flavobacteriia bacterium]|nr:dethiobiotin synthase [Flavobacteriia bacterium]
MKKHFFVTGIGTNVGKTVVSAILSEALKATYWKPVQAGDLDYSDSIKVDILTSKNVNVLEEKYRFNTSASPHLAAEIDGIKIKLSDFRLPSVDSNLIVEGAGGLMVPINNEGDLYIDIIQQFKLPVILVSMHYLGSINHTLLSIEALKSRNIQIEGIVFVGDENSATEKIILQKMKLNVIARIPFTDKIDYEFIQNQSKKINSNYSD